jgi:hypothetical protein
MTLTQYSHNIKKMLKILNNILGILCAYRVNKPIKDCVDKEVHVIALLIIN